jgi:hypothetical protein
MRPWDGWPTRSAAGRLDRRETDRSGLMMRSRPANSLILNAKDIQEPTDPGGTSRSSR